MDNKIKTIVDALQEIKTAPIGIKTESEYKDLTNKYNMMFLGSKFNVITSLELSHYLRENIDSSISHEFLMSVLPKIKDDLSLELEAQILLEDIEKTERKTANYLIYLF